MRALFRFAIVLKLLFSAAAPAAAAERIVNFVSDVVVERNGDLRVTETIDVEAEGQSIRHGVYRDFPTRYRLPGGAPADVGFHLEGVRLDGAAEDFVVERIENGVRIRIGEAGRSLAPGRHSYAIQYRTTRQIGFFADHDELYWNATGSGWIFPIDMAEARITLPENVPFQKAAFYTGAQGETGKNASIVEERAGQITFRTTRPLPAHNGLTVVAAWRKGVIEPPSGARQAGQWLEDNPGLAIMIAGFPATLAYYAFAWARVGRDPPTGTVIPLFGPPDGLSPAATRYVECMAFDDVCFTAAIVNLGVKRHLRIIEEEGVTRLERQTSDKPLSAEEQALLDGLFAEGPALSLEQSNHALISSAREGQQEQLAKAYLGRLFRNNHLWSGLGFLLALPILIGAGFSLPLPSMNFNVSGSLQLPLPLVLGAVAMAMVGGAMAFTGAQRALGGRWTLLAGLALLATSAAGWQLLLKVVDSSLADQLTTGLMLLVGALAGAGIPWLKAPSRKGRKMMDQIEGFREYLSVAEADRLNALNRPKMTPELFERFLPYAIALDCQNDWAAQFASELAAAGAAPQNSTRWYIGDCDWSGDPVSFSDHLGGAFASTLSASATAPGSSSGFGGFSGGGGGGGGGGGW